MFQVTTKLQDKDKNYNYTLYKNAGFRLVNSRDIFYKFRPCIVNLQNFFFM